MQDIHPIKPVIVPDWTGMLISIIALMVFLLVLGLVLRRRKRKQVTVPVIAPPVETIELRQERALKRLTALDRLIAEEKFEQWYVEAALMVKEFASDKYQKQMQELTTEEISKVVHHKDLVELLVTMDQAKFAERGLNLESVKQMRNLVEGYVRGE